MKIKKSKPTKRGLDLFFFDLDDVKESIKKVKKAKRELKRARTKLNSLVCRHWELFEVLFIPTGEEINAYVQKALRKCGYKKVIKIKSIKNREDLQILQGNRKTIIEVKGKERGLISMPDLTTVNRYLVKERAADEKKGKQLSYHGLFVLNHESAMKDVVKRAKTVAFDAERIETAIDHGFGILTIMELFNGYKKLKNGIITFDEFDRILHQPGLVKF